MQFCVKQTVVLLGTAAVTMSCRPAPPAEHEREPAVHLRIGVDTSLPTAADRPRMASLGDSVFRGLVSKATCADCHTGGRATQTTAPDLSRSAWLSGSARYSEVVDFMVHGTRIRSKEVPNRPHGGVRLRPEETRAVAVYLLSLRNSVGGER